MAGIVAYGAYVPYYRLKRSEIAAVLGEGGGKGTRAVASFDEDATSMGVEAARGALRAAPAGATPERILFATANPPYLDKTNATLVQAALGLDERTLAVDVLGSVRSSVGALVTAAESPVPTLVALADVRFGPAGGAEERESGDAGAALLFGPPGDGPVAATVLAHASRSREFLDRWRLPTWASSRTWEDRFGEHVYRRLGSDALADALAEAGTSIDEVDHLAVVGLHGRAVAAVARASGVARERILPDLAARFGNPGAAAPGVALVDALERAEPGQLVALVVLADGATAVLLRAGEAVRSARSGPSLQDQLDRGAEGLAYPTYLIWRGLLEGDVPRRPDPAAPAPAPVNRLAGYKLGFAGTRCAGCSAVHLPPSRVCASCGEQDRMEEVPMADVVGTVRTVTVDHLVFSLHPPTASAVLDLDGGGRCTVDLTDVDPSTVAIGDRIELTFRRLHSTNGIHNYFWKGRPARQRAEA